MEDLVEVVGGVVRPQIRPKRLQNLLAVEAVFRCQSQQLDEAPGLPQAPPILFDEPGSDPEAKATEQHDAYHLRLVPLSPNRAVAVLQVLVVMGRWLALGVATHPRSPYICFQRKPSAASCCGG